ncbi:O-antigen ligase family protein [Parvibaculum sp.]|uniref:O-antigen ligase family protein n=1 Tax=Parvibaculum sp. TaxID=2024848 RepID=UPI003298EBC6
MLLAATGMLLLLWSLYAAVAKDTIKTDPLQPLIAPTLLYALVLAWIFLQWIPLSSASPEINPSWRNPLWVEASQALAMPLPAHISIDLAASFEGGLRFLAYSGIFWLALSLTCDPARAAQARLAIIAAGATYSLYGLFAFFGGGDWLLGNIGARPDASLTSSFINRNSFATFAGLTLLAAVSLFLERIRHLLGLERPLRRKAALVIEHMIFQSGWLTGVLLVIMLALLLTTSRGGILASFFALGALILLQLGRRSRAPGQPIGFAILIIVGIAVIAGGGNFIDRLERQGLSLEADLRTTLFATTTSAIQTAPLTGTGLGTYELAIEPYRANDPNIFALWEKAHNTYLENAMELGLVAALALNLSILLLARIAFRGIGARKRHKSFPALGVAATLLVGLHALVDFSLQIPAVAVLYAFMMGLAVAQSAPARQRAPSPIKA